MTIRQGIIRSTSATIASAAFALAALTTTASAVDLTVYTAVEAEDLKKYAARFNEDHPDINIKWVRDSTGIVTAKLLAEKENPQADVIWGLAATSLLLMKGEDMLEPYKPAGAGMFRWLESAAWWWWSGELWGWPSRLEPGRMRSGHSLRW